MLGRDDHRGSTTAAEDLVGSRPLTALIVDYVGVLTLPIQEAMARWMVADGLDAVRFPAFMHELMTRSVHDEDGPVHRLEVGAISKDLFEETFAAEIAAAGLGSVPAEGLLARMTSGMQPDEAMLATVAKAKAAGVRTALLSNAFGFEYPRAGWGDLFDATVISDEVGIRKPDPAIYLMVCDRLRIDPAEAIYVDDMQPNVAAAANLGMTAIHHTTADTTVPRLRALLGI